MRRKIPLTNKAEGRNAWQISTSGEWRSSISVQTGNRRKEGTREPGQQPEERQRSFCEQKKGDNPQKLQVSEQKEEGNKSVVFFCGFTDHSK